MEYITKKDLIDCSTPDEFCFSLCCMECKTVWKSTPIRFSKAGKKPENENRKIIYDTLYDREKNLAFQKALNQAKEFSEVTELSGIVLTKLDGTAKGGIAVAIQAELGIPVKYIGVGETIDDLEKFNAEEFVNALFYTDEQ